MTTIPLQTKSLSKSYDKAPPALHPLDLCLEPGEIFGLLGPNGAGKTTLISMLTGLIDPSSGSASIMGYDIAEQSLLARLNVGVVPQELVSHGFFSIERVLEFHSGYFGLTDNREHIDYLLRKLGLHEHRRKLVRQLSGGMKRRLLIAKSLVHRPPLLLLDEPTAGVDVELRNDLWQFVRELNRDMGTTVLLTTHYIQEAEELCNRIGVLHLGRLIALDDTISLIHRLTRRIVSIKLTADTDMSRFDPTLVLADHCLQISTAYGTTVGKLIQELDIPLASIEDISVEEGTLEDAFVALIQEQSFLKNEEEA
ncbi:ABC transporter ATP-binding protein [Desulfurispirillum indicum]|uniref:ABC transporter related protein n=1 Tax=Desulfurispirillum indicum (strain ATCC BAA-1389 / DSM 22839 / S5) TaxID=653733 RepID=E6W3F0_DESIS|nr:ABC transporter ATP-binding protein [Desulfurispirillum indicum]ADU65743.1 ABC transporter related protein [Desulfurispirillum indicum S5]UCZ57676.1 ABC transporter ATP-binding protein [Desulfurispirillum indicum]